MAARLDYATYRMEGFVVEEPHPFPSPWPCFRVAAQKQQHGFVRGASRGGLFHSLLGVGCTLGHCAKLDLSNLLIFLGRASLDALNVSVYLGTHPASQRSLLLMGVSFPQPDLVTGPWCYFLLLVHLLCVHRLSRGWPPCVQ